MRGDGDEAHGRGRRHPAAGNQVVADQRKIIAEVTGKPAEKTPQVWALYKEVQDYYDHGMQVPDDVTLLFSDDNWGRSARLPEAGQDPRAGRLRRLLPLRLCRRAAELQVAEHQPGGARPGQQMDLAYALRAPTVCGSSMSATSSRWSMPLDFFIDMAWNPEAMTVGKMAGFTRDWARRPVRSRARRRDHAVLLDGYTQLNAQRKPG